MRQVDQIGLGFDASQDLTYEQAQSLKEWGFLHALRNCAGVSDDKFIQDVQGCLHAGLTVGIYQGSYRSMWNDSGRTRAGQAILKARAVGYPEQATLWLNVEDITSKEEARRFIEEWASAVRDAGYGAGVYCGCNTFSGDEYWNLKGITHYWLNGSPGCRIEVPNRGFQVYQLTVDSWIQGINLDIDFFQIDALGQSPEGMIL